MVTKKRVKQKIPARDEDAQSFERFLSLLPRENQPDVLLKLFVSLKKKRKSCPRDRQAVTHSTNPPGDSRRLVRSSYLESRHVRFIRGIVKSGKSDVCGMDISVGYDMSAYAVFASFVLSHLSMTACFRSPDVSTSKHTDGVPLIHPPLEAQVEINAGVVVT